MERAVLVHQGLSDSDSDIVLRLRCWPRSPRDTLYTSIFRPGYPIPCRRLPRCFHPRGVCMCSCRLQGHTHTVPEAMTISQSSLKAWRDLAWLGAHPTYSVACNRTINYIHHYCYVEYSLQGLMMWPLGQFPSTSFSRHSSQRQVIPSQYLPPLGSSKSEV